MDEMEGKDSDTDLRGDEIDVNSGKGGETNRVQQEKGVSKALANWMTIVEKIEKKKIIPREFQFR